MILTNYKGWELFSYVGWLRKKLENDAVPDEVQDFYIEVLHSIPYRYVMDIDSNRYKDGISLRYKYMEEAVIPVAFYGEEVGCSVLEMLASMAIKCSTNVMGETPGYWFWDWINNLSPGLNDSRYVLIERVNRWLDRDFDSKGFGSPFPLRKMRDIYDQRLVNSWDQMCGYLSENIVGLE